jgi:hypothetical protein
MKKFLVTYHAPAHAMAQTANTTPEQQAEGMKMWMNWFGKLGNHVVDMGAPLMNGQEIDNNGHAHSSNRQVSGYTIIQAEDIEQAKALMEGHPHTSGWHPDATLEVHETMPIPGM